MLTFARQLWKHYALFAFLIVAGNAASQTISIYDNAADNSGDITGTIDYDTADNRNISIAWDLPQNGATDWHVYVRKNLDGMKYLGRTGSGGVMRLDWSPNATGIATAFAKGPDFDAVYSFRVVRIDGTITQDDVLNQQGVTGFQIEGGTPVSLTLSENPNVQTGQAVVYDDLLGGDNLVVNGEDVDEPGARAVQVAWNFGIQPESVQEYHVLISVDHAPYQLLGQTGSGTVTYFTWNAKGSFRTAQPFADGPQHDKTYRFRVVMIPFSGNRQSLTTSPVRFLTQEINNTPTPVPPVNTPTATPIPGFNLPQMVIDLPELPGGAVKLNMVRMTADTYTIGSHEDEFGREDDEGPQHQVTVSRDFYISQFEVTQAQYRAVMNANPSAAIDNNYPVINVTWQEAIQFCNALSALQDRTPAYTENPFSFSPGGNGFRLPTEAEWELAARAGTTTRFYWGDDLEGTQLGSFSWYKGNAGELPKLVGKKIPNAFGLFDMSGNVWEWCTDTYQPYTAGHKTDPVSLVEGSEKVIRGGGWLSIIDQLRSASRHGLDQGSRIGTIGFRIVSTVVE